MTKMVNLQIPKNIYDSLLSYNLENGIDLNKYINKDYNNYLKFIDSIDATTYLSLSEANKKALDEAINQKECIEMEYVNGRFRKKK